MHQPQVLTVYFVAQPTSNHTNMKIAKKLLLGFGILIALLLALAIILPVVYKDEIIALVKAEANKAVNAEIAFGDVGLSLFKDFPNFSLSVSDFSVTGKAPFEGVALAKGKTAAFSLDLMSVIKADRPVSVKSISLEAPALHVIVLKNGQANYDIALPSDAVAEEAAPTEGYGNLVINLDEYSITDGSLIYDDHSLDAYVSLSGLNHNGNGNFTIDVYDLDTHTDIGALTVSYGGITYLNEARASLDAIFNIDQPNAVYTLKDNKLTLNELQIVADGKIAMPGEDIDLDLSFSSPQNDFKRLLSMVPNAYIEGYEDVKANGQFQLQGEVKGIYNDTSYPAFELRAAVSDGQVQYPGLPASINDINARATVNSPSSDFDDLVVDVTRFGLSLAGSPFNASFRLSTPMSDPALQATAKGKIVLEDLARAFPMEGVEQLQGLINADLAIDTRLSFIEQEAYEQVNMSGNLDLSGMKYAAEDMPVVSIAEASMAFSPQFVALRSFDAQLGQSDIQASGRIDNLLAYFSPDKTLKGSLRIRSNTFDANEWMPAESSESTDASAVAPDTTASAEVFDRFDFILDAAIGELIYDSYRIKEATAVGHMTSNMLQVEELSGNLGGNDFLLRGTLTGIFGYLFDAGMLSGDIQFRSANLNLNDFMGEEEATAAVPAEGEEAAYSVIPVPPNININAMAEIGRLQYTNIDLKKVSGHLVIADEAVVLDQVKANGLGGEMLMSGSYDTSDPEAPGFSFKYDLSGLDFQQAFTTLNTFEQLAPIGKYIDGKFNSTLLLNGVLGQDLYPKLSSINAEGFLQTMNAVIENFKPLQSVGEKLNVDYLRERIPIKNSKNWFTIENGTLALQEFDTKVRDIAMTVGGTYSITDFLNLKVKATVPRKTLEKNAVGAAANQGLRFLQSEAGKLGINLAQGENINVLINLTGAITAPKTSLKLLGMDGEEDTSLGDQVKEQVRDEAKQKLEEGKQAARDAAQQAADSLRAEAQKRAEQAAKDAAAKAAEELKKKLGNKVDSTAQQKIDSLLNQAGGKTADDIKDKLEKFNPFKRKKNGN